MNALTKISQTHPLAVDLVLAAVFVALIISSQWPAKGTSAELPLLAASVVPLGLRAYLALRRRS